MSRLLNALIYLVCLGILGVGAVGVYETMAAAPTGHEKAETVGKPWSLPSFSLSELFAPAPFGGRERVSIMIVGSDEGGGERGRADTLMVLFLNPQKHRAALLSFPRDLRVNIPGHKTDKINHTYRFGGVPLTRKTVEGFLGTPIDYYAHSDFKSFVKCADMLGGCDLEVPDVEGKGRGMNYDDNWGNLHIHLRPGYQHLNAEQCIGFVRYRHGDSDINRTQRQQQFLKAMFEQKLKVQNLPQLLRAGAFIMRTLDTDLDWRGVTDLTRSLKQTPMENVLSATIPMKDAMIGGIYYAMPQMSRLHDLLAAIDQHLSSEPAKPCEVVLVNGTGKAQLTSEAAQMLQVKGFQIAKTAEAKGTVKRSQVLFEEKQYATASRVSTILRIDGADVAPTQKTEDPRAPIQVVLGRDFYGQAGPPKAAPAKAAPGVKPKPNPFAPRKKKATTSEQ